MTYETMVSIPLAQSFLCADCHSVGNQNQRCPACASTVLMALEPVMNRVPNAPSENLNRYMDEPLLERQGGEA